ncbi:acetyl esterase/lipase [Arthrobacter sp. V1I7]|uniref:alpha/beta hydrolase n=1 Tax=Arthrobacter sp. V1I7 TaxID=3042274 RepID=UPI002781F3D0|nr:alpha/beta hydrolase [Arthrobacter sp. V1I7]MDQ0823777.1 acetyl esterase/lipase [Arthrobacter sp. V1I7]
MAAGRAPDETRVQRQDFTISRGSGKPGLDVRVYRPQALVPPSAGILYIHGGGMVMGSIAADDAYAAALAVDVGCTVVSVGYGLAPENPGTGPVEDCYDALVWLVAQASEIGVDVGRLAVFGVSAGGGIACGLSLLARDRGTPRLTYQMLIYPMLDDRSATPSSHAIVDLGVWDRAANLEAWRHLLGEDVGGSDVSPYAAPARETELSGLPATYLDVGDLDLFFDEDIQLAQRLANCGVPLELHVYPGAYHGFDQIAPGADMAKTARGNRLAALRRALATASSAIQSEGRK